MSTLTCCTSHDVDKIYHPGAVVTIHWIRQTTYRLAPAHPARITLEAELDGGFAAITQAKAAHAHGSEHVHAAPVRVTDGAMTAPVSRLRIPPTASPGLYNLTTTVDFGSGSTASGTTTIRVAAH